MLRTLHAPALAALALAVAPAAGLVAIAPSAASAQTPADATQKFNAFLDAEFAEALKFSPQTATTLGRKEGYDRLNDLSEAAELKALEWRRGSVARMKQGFQRDKLSDEGKISFDMWSQELDRAELAYRFRRYDFPFGGGGAHSGLPSFLISSHLVDGAADMKAYNARLRALGPAMDQARERAVAAAGDGIRMPRFAYERMIAESRKLISGQPFAAEGPDSPLWTDAKAKVARLSAAGKVTPQEAQALLDEAKAALTTGMKPGYERLIAWGEGDIGKAPSGKVGALTLPKGLDWYQAAITLQTTTTLTPDQIHSLGLSEVKRIQGEQDALAQKAGFKDADAYYAELNRADPPQPYTDENRAEILAYSNSLIAKSRAALPAMFNNLPAYKMEVIREPSFSEVAGGAAHASGPSPDGARPGRVYLHMLGKTSLRASLADLMCHEGVPGHVMQGDLRVRQKGAPQFRLAARNAAFNEGWGLYSELLCKEMGVYPDIASDFMRLDAELFRAARLVTDTGLHAKGWTEDEAVAYLKATGRRGDDQARAETRRYIVNPGQATAYKIGMIRILQLRGEAQKALGPKFDIKAFNDTVIASGSLPLSVLDQRIKDWVAEQKRG
ncbi:DUF885 family protein [Phenylobacterium sp.]|uniref:DUF885 domain-containing protein n=1 Tax=Phenylobacterium sp. TaxID=1871053 RepID=UPI0025E22541|nr:DUF885 domain-containing protein [Phenylobacterium sp.]